MKIKLISICIIGLLTGCGGSSSSEDNLVAVTGSFQLSADTGVYYAPDINGFYEYDSLGWYSQDCRDSRNRYYETDNVLVFGSEDLPDSDFETAATWVENYFPLALDAMHMTQAEYFEKRTSARWYARNTMFTMLNSLTSTPDLSVGDYSIPEDIRAEYDNDIESFYYDMYDWAVAQATTASADVVVSTINAGADSGVYSGLTLEDKLYVCLTQIEEDSIWGEGTYTGIVFAAPSVKKKSGIKGLITHELVHTLQLSLIMDATGAYRLPRWWLEGQANYLVSGTSIKKSKHNEYDPTLVVSSDDEVGDIGDAYSHYTLAYRYLEEANGRDQLLSLMTQLKSLVSNAYDSRYDSGYEDYQYIELFDSMMVDMDGNALSVDQWRYDYHSYMEAWANQ